VRVSLLSLLIIQNTNIIYIIIHLTIPVFGWDSSSPRVNADSDREFACSPHTAVLPEALMTTAFVATYISWTFGVQQRVSITVSKIKDSPPKSVFHNVYVVIDGILYRRIVTQLLCTFSA
jgi:hypothetical protein